MEYKEKAFEQLEIYSLALRQLHPDKEINLAVVFPLVEKAFVVKAPEQSVVLKKFNLSI